MNEGGGGYCIFIYSGSARLISFEIRLISKETSREESEYIDMLIPPHPPPPQDYRSVPDPKAVQVSDLISRLVAACLQAIKIDL